MGCDLSQAAIALRSELDKMAGDCGAFSVAAAATDSGWIESKRQEVLSQLRKTRSELRHVEMALQRIEHQMMFFGKDGKENAIELEYIPLEGWVLTLIDNYVNLVAFRGEYDRRNIFDRIEEFTDGSIRNSKNLPDGAKKMNHVKLQLNDNSVIYG